VKKLLGMQAYWARKGIVCDLVVLCSDPAVAKDVTDATNELHGVFVVDETGAGPGAVELLDSVARLRVGSP
jgi:hypothetical protein